MVTQVSGSRIGCSIAFAIGAALLAGLLVLIPGSVIFGCVNYTKTFAINQSTWNCTSDEMRSFCGTPEEDVIQPWCRAESQNECWKVVPDAPSHFYMYHPYQHWEILTLRQSVLPDPLPTFTSVKFNNPNLTFYNPHLVPWDCQPAGVCQEFHVTMIGLYEAVDLYSSQISIPSTSDFWVKFSLGNHCDGNTVRILFDDMTLSGQHCPRPFHPAWIFLPWALIWVGVCLFCHCCCPQPEKLACSQKILAQCSRYQTVDTEELQSDDQV